MRQEPLVLPYFDNLNVNNLYSSCLFDFLRIHSYLKSQLIFTPQRYDFIFNWQNVFYKIFIQKKRELHSPLFSNLCPLKKFLNYIMKNQPYSKKNQLDLSMRMEDLTKYEWILKKNKYRWQRSNWFTMQIYDLFFNWQNN